MTKNVNGCQRSKGVLLCRPLTTVDCAGKIDFHYFIYYVYSTFLCYVNKCLYEGGLKTHFLSTVEKGKS